MITSINRDNQDNYIELFNKADLALGEGSEIDSLIEYFTKIETLAKKDLVFTRLPLDETFFSINANDRTITVPPAFKTNGVSVKGDQVSEILYFKIDRFFDATDLGDLENRLNEDGSVNIKRALSADKMNIVIQWENAIGETGVSLAWAPDIESDPNYVIFGWPIDSKITKAAGTVKFSIRFFRRSGDTQVFNFSTLTQSVLIKPSLDFDLLENQPDENLNQYILNRIKNTEDVTRPAAAVPEFSYLNWENEGHKIIDDNLNIRYWKNLESDNSLYLKAQAFSADAGIISYKWYKSGDPQELNSELIYEFTTDTKAKANKLYYEKKTSGGIKYLVKALEVGDEIEENTLYECYSSLNLTGDNLIGAYFVEATNRHDINTKSIQSSYCVVQGAGNIIFDIDLPNEATLEDKLEVSIHDENRFNPGQIEHKWQKAVGNEWSDIDNGNELSYQPTDIGKYRIHVLNTLNTDNKHFYSNETNVKYYNYEIKLKAPSKDNYSISKSDKLEIVINKTPGLKGEFEYQWYFGNSEINGATNSYYILAGGNSVGSYYCKVSYSNNDPSNEKLKVMSDAFNVIA